MVVVLALSAGSAMGQTRHGGMGPAAQQSPAQESVALAFRQLGLAMDAMVAENRDREQALRQKTADMDAYLKACGDKPGCTVPAEDVK